MTKILTIVGARPQFIKAAVVSRAMASVDGLEEILVHTGQHYDANMSDVFFGEMEIPHPRYNLGIHGVGHGAMTGRMLAGIEKILLDEKPDVLLVYGDTNSTLAGALAAKKIHIKVAHVEAGLRSFNMEMPEEINRILTDRISDWLFCPTQTAVDNLRQEGFGSMDTQIHLCGDVMYDAALFYANKAGKQSRFLETIGLEHPFVLSTIHRQENTDDPTRLQAIFAGLEAIHEHTTVVMPLHPRTRKVLDKEGLSPQIQFIDPVGYLEMVQLLEACSMVVTDSGGLQKEAYFFKKCCITARDQTEWVELVENGFNALTGADTSGIMAAFEAFSVSNQAFDLPLYGNGNAAGLIVETIASV